MKPTKKYRRPNPVISGQVPPDVRETLEAISEAYAPTVSQLVAEVVIYGLPKLLRKYPVERTNNNVEAAA